MLLDSSSFVEGQNWLLMVLFGLLPSFVYMSKKGETLYVFSQKILFLPARNLFLLSHFTSLKPAFSFGALPCCWVYYYRVDAQAISWGNEQEIGEESPFVQRQVCFSWHMLFTRRLPEFVAGRLWRTAAVKNDQTRTASVPGLARLAVAIFFFLVGETFASWATRIPDVKARLGLSTGQLGLALLGIAAGELVALHLSGYLSVRFGSRLITTIAAIGLCLLLPCLALAPGLPILIAALLLFGAAFGSVNVAMNTQAVTVEKGYGRTILNSFHACYSLGGLAGSLIGGLVSAHGIAPLTHFLGIALLNICVILLVASFLLSPQVDAQKTGIVFVRPTRVLLILGLVAFCVVLGEGAMADWSAVYLSTALHSGTGLAAAGYAAFSVVMAGGRILGDRPTALIGPGNMIRMGGLVAAAGLTLALLAPWVPLALVGFGLVGAGFSVIFPLTLSATGRLSDMASGAAIATVTTCGYLGFLIGPAVIGLVADALTLRIALGFVVILSLCAASCARVVESTKPARPDQASTEVEPSNPLSL